ncbi:PREDICTED: uncharacterized protein LOC102257229, partial [Myotis brandtii]|uniref:uncharacterized protein LOC102257229 n=1 Tax=Myotis brandtii TaxID=109478 RepID=UPI0003BB7EA8
LGTCVTRDEGFHLECKKIPIKRNSQCIDKSLLAPRSQLTLAAFNVRTLMQIGSQAALARTLETLAIDVCCLSETRIQDSCTVLQLTSPSVDSKSSFTLRLSGDTPAQAAGVAGVGIALSARAENALVEWIPINSRLCAVRLETSVKPSKQERTKRCLFVISAYAPTDCSSDAVKDEFYERLTELLHKKRRTDIVVLAGDLNAQLGRLAADERELGGRHTHGSHRTDNGERLLHFCADHGLFLSSTNFRRSWRQRATWRPSTPGQSWTQIDHIAISYRWRGCITDCKSIWSTCLSSDHALLYARFALRFGGCPKRNRKRIDAEKLADPQMLEKYQKVLASRLAVVATPDVDAHWSHIRSAMYKSAIAVCGFTKRAVKHWISARSLELLDARRNIPSGSEYNSIRKITNAELKAHLRQDREAWWEQRATELEQAAMCGNHRKLFQLIRATGGKMPAVSETICEVDGAPIHNLQRRLERWAEHFEQQFNWPSAPLTLSSSTQNVPWSVDVSPPTETEVSNELRLLKRHKSPGPDELPPALFKDGGPILIKELTSLLQKVWSSEFVPSEWGMADIIPIFKKGLRNVCNNHRGISLLPVASKILASIILRRLSRAREQNIREEQAGFRPGRGCSDHIFTL